MGAWESIQSSVRDFFALRLSRAEAPGYYRAAPPGLGSDLLPAFRTSPSMISDEGKGKGYVEEQAHGSGDDWSAETTGGGAESGGCGAGSGSIEAHDLCLEGEVRRHGCKPGAGSQ